MSRNNQKQIWSDQEFYRALERIKAKRMLSGQPIKNHADITRLIVRMPSFKNVEAEIVDINKKLKELRFDGEI